MKELDRQILIASKVSAASSQAFSGFVEMASIDEPEDLLKREPTVKVVTEPTERFKPSGEQKDHAHVVPAGTTMDLGSGAMPTRAKKTCFSMCMRVNLQDSLTPEQVSGRAATNINAIKGVEQMRDSQCQKLCVKTTAAVVASIGSDVKMPKTDNGIAGSVTYPDKNRADNGGVIDVAVFDATVSHSSCAVSSVTYYSLTFHCITCRA